MRRGDLQHAGTKLNIDVVIRHDRQVRLILHRQRSHCVLADQLAVARILRVHRNGRVSRDGLRSGGGNLQPGIRLFHHLYLEIKELAVLLFHDDLLIRECGQRFRTPIHHALTAIDETLLVQIHKHALHASRVFLIHRKAQTRPVTTRAELFQLLDDDAAVLLFPFPDVLEQLLATEIIAMPHGTFLDQLTLHHALRGNARVIRARQPQHFLAVHARFAGEDILNGVIEHVPHVQHAGDVGRRDDNGKRRPLFRYTLGIRGETIVLFPERIPLVLHRLRFVSLGNLRHDYFFNNRNSMLSSSACRLASMMFSFTPTVYQRSLPSVDSMSTRVLAAVPEAREEFKIRTL